MAPLRSRRPALAAAAALAALAALAATPTPAPDAAGNAPVGPVGPVGPVPAVAGPHAPSPPANATTARRSRTAYDTTSRDAVRDAYRRHLLPQLQAEPAVLPTGCSVGGTPTATQRRTIAAVNYARRMVGVDPVRLDAGLSRDAQRAALIQHALGYLTHTPASDAPCWSAVGSRAAGQSNLASGYEGAATVLAYLADPGAGNTAAGHRRWLLAPATEAMGTGQVGAFNALLVVPPDRLRSDANPSPAWIRWPTAGWFPVEMEPGRRWSLSSTRPGLDLRRATVHVKVGGKAVEVRRYAPQAGYGGQSALVWDLLQPISVPADGVRVATVTVRGMKVGRRALPVQRYTVRLFHAG